MSRRKQPQRLPPPLMHGNEAIDSEAVLREFEGETGVVLWKTVRSVRLWSELAPGERGGAFEVEAHCRRAELVAAADLPAGVQEALVKAAGVLRGRARAATISRACRQVSEWAAEVGKLGTAIEFMQAAAVAQPGDAEIAHEVARLGRTRADYQRAETWYREAVARARRSRDWREFSRSYIGMGTVFALRGAYPQAAKSLIRGLRAAKRFSLRPLVAAAAHELVVVGIRTDRAPEVARYARLAVEAYGCGHPRLPALAHDVGVFLLNAGYLDAARRILSATPADFGSATDRLARWSSLVRVAGAVGDREMYCRALAMAEQLLREPDIGPCTVQAHLAIARGADSIGDTERALAAASTAAALAAERGEAQLQFAAASVLESVQNRSDAAEETRLAAATPGPLANLVEDLEAAMGAGSR